MPVPVPCRSKQPAHLVIKPHFSDDGVNHSFQDLTGTLPVSPTGPPPSFGTREQWINSLPSWRRRQDFQKGLALADNASAIKGSRAQACRPPLFTLSQANDVEMLPHGSFDPAEMHTQYKASSIATTMETYDEQDRGAFTPIFEEESPEARSSNEVSSSPIEPVTPFGDYVDRAVNSVSYSAAFVGNNKVQGYCFVQPAVDVAKEPALAPAPAPELVTPTATSGYRKLSEPLSEWIANFVWKACTTGTNVPSFIVRPRLCPSKTYAVSPPSYLSTSVHSLLLSTLLQPSAIFLALWYIVRLPVFFGAVNFSTEHVKELRFRVALLGENHGLDRDATENNAPFRLIVLGCMLANKWLDDHTFSNKTWHSISNVPIQTLNKLESLTLDIFAHDLSISSGDWSDWLSHVMSYHVSLSPSHRQPISRPSANPHLIIRFAIEEILHASDAGKLDALHPQPVFMGLEERRKEKQAKEQAKADVIEIDLDEDGPLREEYMPKRRASGASSTRSTENVSVDQRSNWDKSVIENYLPPPAKWSPAADEPILRESNRPCGRYVAVQPTPGFSVPVPSYQVIPQYQAAHDFSYATQSWLPSAPLLNTGHVFDLPSLQHPSAYNPCLPLLLPFALSHSRSQSHSHDQDTSQSRNHTRSYSQSQFEYRCSDLRMTANELPPVPQDVEMTWALPGHYGYGAPAFAPHPTYQSGWLRT